MKGSAWILCPRCGAKTRNRIRDDTVMIRYPLFCPKCKEQILVNVEKMKITVINEPDAKTQS